LQEHRLVLASASPRRKDLLEQVGLDFEVIPSEVEEVLSKDMDVALAVQKLAYDKGLWVRDRLSSDALVIAADTVVVLEHDVMGKPRDRDEAFAMLSSLQGKTHEVITGLVVMSKERHLIEHEATRVTMRELTDQEIWNYVDSGEPMDKAGSYAVQGLGAVIIANIEGCYFNVVGLPLARLAIMLKDFGFRIL